MNRFLNALNLRTKIVGTAVLILLIFSISSGYTLYSMAGISNELTLISEKDLPLTQVISEVTVHQLEQTIAYGNAIRFAYSDGVKSASVKESIGRFRTLSIAVDEEIERAHDIAISANETSDERTRSEFEKIDAAIKDITVSHKAFEQEVEQAFDALLRADFETVGSVSASIDDHAEELDHALEDLQQEIVAFTRQSAVIATAHEKTALNTTMFLVAISIVVGLLVSWIVASAIIRGIRKAIVTASGDLSQEIVVDSRDELASYLRP